MAPSQANDAALDIQSAGIDERRVQRVVPVVPLLINWPALPMVPPPRLETSAVMVIVPAATLVRVAPA